MQVHQAMTKHAEYLLADATLEQAAQKMRDLDLGFLPISDKEESKLQGIITDRDIAVRGVAEGLDPRTAKAAEMETEAVRYCYEQDSLEEAAEAMQEAGTYRLVVLNNREDKKLCGVISLGDILRQKKTRLSAETAREIMS